MNILIAIGILAIGIILGRLSAQTEIRGTLMKVLDDYEKTAASLYLVLNCQPNELKAGEIVKFQVKETHPQK
jgi:hypothetical protein